MRHHATPNPFELARRSRERRRKLRDRFALVRTPLRKSLGERDGLRRHEADGRGDREGFPPEPLRNVFDGIRPRPRRRGVETVDLEGRCRFARPPLRVFRRSVHMARLRRAGALERRRLRTKKLEGLRHWCRLSVPVASSDGYDPFVLALSAFVPACAGLRCVRTAPRSSLWHANCSLSRRSHEKEGIGGVYGFWCSRGGDARFGL